MLKIYAFFREEKLIFEILVQGKLTFEFVFYIPVKDSDPSLRGEDSLDFDLSGLE